MAHEAAVHLTALCAILSFLWLSRTFERHSLGDDPWRSFALILLISGLLCFAVGLCSSRLPGANGRFDDEAPLLLKAPSHAPPRRPRRFFLPCLVACIVLRLELLHFVSARQQCATPGVEAYLCFLLAVYETWSARRSRRGATAVVPEDELDDPWGYLADDLARLFSGSLGTATSLAAVLCLSHGVFLAASQTPRSTYVCSATLDAPATVLVAQLAGLLLDATAAVLGWRVLGWARTTKARLSTLGTVLLLAAALASAVLVGARLSGPGYGSGGGWATDGTPHLFDAVVDGAAVGGLVICACLVMCETGPTTLASVLTAVAGVAASKQNLAELGSWRRSPSRLEVVLPVCLVSTGYVVHMYVTGSRPVVLGRQGLASTLFCGFVVYAAVTALSRPLLLEKHPLGRIISAARSEQDLWARRATWSGSVQVAAAEYRRRNGGREPPAGFDRWLEFARAHQSAVIDSFDQIGSDLLPFWEMAPALVRTRAEKASTGDGIATVSVRRGVVSHTGAAPDPAAVRMLNRLVETIESFSHHLPDLTVPVNLGSRPRVLAPWAERGSGLVPGKRKGRKGEEEGRRGEKNEGPFAAAVLEPPVLRRIEALACPAGTEAAAAARNVRDFCAACVRPYSRGEFVGDWARSLEVCAQPDLAHLHGLHLMAPAAGSGPFQTLVPVFSRAKTASFSDILIPLLEESDGDEDGDRAGDEDKNEGKDDGDKDQSDSRRLLGGGAEFLIRQNSLFWRGRVGERAVTGADLRGNQAHRLLRLVNSASATDTATVLLPVDPARPGTTFQYVVLPLAEANAAIPLDVAVASYGGCGRPAGTVGVEGEGDDVDLCAPLRLELGAAVGEKRDEEEAKPEYRFQLLLDGNDGPAPGLLAALRSNGAPVVATVFRTWYTERLAAWVHFVPVDVRLHGLHSTMAYFLGVGGGGDDGTGGGMRMAGNVGDGEWIAGEGRKWAQKAIRPREDGAVYLFRLLLEWGRVMSDDRDDMSWTDSNLQVGQAGVI